jgi:tetratricopeptide (TPR) repeat protein
MQPLETTHAIPDPINGSQNLLSRSPSIAIASKADVLRALRGHIREAAQQGNFRRAIAILNHLILHYPTCVAYYNNRGLMYHYCHQWPQAMADYNQALALGPTNDRVHNNRANCLAAQGQWLDAIADYDRAIDLNPFNIQARINQGATFRDMGKYDEALACFDIALFFGAAQAIIYAERGRTYYLQGHWNCAMGDYQHALANIATDQSDKNSNNGSHSLKRRINHWIDELLLLSA